MCLILFSYKQIPGYRLVLAANRDEFVDRPTAPLGHHYDGENILAGRDLREGGTWLGLDAAGRLGAITNYRDPGRVLVSAPSRGEIILDYLRSHCTPSDFLNGLNRDSARFNGFNLLLSDMNGMFYYSNIRSEIRKLDPGIYGLSNHLLNTAWPKVERGKAMLQQALDNRKPDFELLFDLLFCTEQPADEQLPETGVGLEWERLLAPLFIRSRSYGTRSSTVITISDEGVVCCEERSWQHGEQVLEGERAEYSFKIQAA